MSESSTKKRFTLVQKLIAGYSAITIFTLASLISSLFGLYSINNITKEIVKTDLVFVNTIIKLRDSILAQERFASKYEILKSPEFVGLFQKRQIEFMELLDNVNNSNRKVEYQQIMANYGRFKLTAEELFSGKTTSINYLKKASTKIVNSLDAIYQKEQLQLNSKLISADRKESSSVKLTLFFSLTGLLFAIGISVFSILNISKAISKLQKATHRIAEGDFDYNPQIPPGDEIGALAEDFTSMAERLKISEQLNLDASPLTRLPGNIAIERVLNKRLAENKPFAVCYGDLDNFKAYNDRYGYVKASEIIKITAEIIYESAKDFGDDEAFVGHVGGDDFVVVVSKETAEAVSKDIISRFDREIINHYSEEDLENGAIKGVDRYGVPRTFPIMTISIAVVMCNSKEFDSAVEIAKTAAQIKDYAKGFAGSNFFVNRRGSMR